MPPTIFINLASAIIGNRLAKAGAWFLIMLLIVGLLLVGKCAYDGRIVADHETKVTEKALKADTKAKDEAADQRATDTIIINQAEKEREDAINQKPAEAPDAARNRLNCNRMRRAGIDTAAFAECR